MNNSNQFPVKEDGKKEHLPMNARAQFILLGLEKNCPNLYKDIISRNETDLTKIKK